MNRILTRIANNVSPRMHEEVNLHVINGDNNRSKLEQADMNFIIARRLIADLPLNPSNDLLYTIIDNIRAGLYNDLIPYEQNWNKCLQRTKNLLIKTGRLMQYDTSIQKSIIIDRR